MTIYDKHLTRSAAALIAAGTHLQRKDAGDPFDLLAKRFGDHASETLKRIGETDTRISGVAAQLAEIEQKMARGGGNGQPVTPDSWGEQFTKAPGLADFAGEHSRPSRFRLQMKTTITTGATSGGSLDVPQRDMAITMPRRRLAVRDLLPVIQVSSNSVEYPKQTTRTNAAAPVAEGAVKPESAYAFQLQTVNTQVIAHWIPASRQVLDDAPQLRGIIDGELRYGLALAEETQLLYGDNTGANLNGMVPQATAYVAPFTVPSPTMIDLLGLAIVQAALADFPPDGIVIHPSDWMRIRLTKDADGKYIFGDPQRAVEPTLFGLPVVATQAIDVDKFLVGNFQAAATLRSLGRPG